MNEITEVVTVEDTAFGSDPHTDGMSFDQLMDESTEAQKGVPAECNPVELILDVEEKVSRAGNPTYHIKGTVTGAADDIDPRNGKSILGREVTFYMQKHPKGLSASGALRWVKGAKSQLDIDIWPADTGRFPDYSLLQGATLSGTLSYSNAKDGERPFCNFTPEVAE